MGYTRGEIQWVMLLGDSHRAKSRGLCFMGFIRGKIQGVMLYGVHQGRNPGGNAFWGSQGAKSRG